jgi:hypothetical protein
VNGFFLEKGFHLIGRTTQIDFEAQKKANGFLIGGL